MEFTRPTPEEIRVHKALVEAISATTALFYSMENDPSNSRVAALGSVIASLIDKAHSEHGWTVSECKQVLEYVPEILVKTGFDALGLTEVDK